MLDLVIIAMQLAILSALFARWWFLDKRHAKLSEEKDAILRKLEDSEAEPVDLGQQGETWKDGYGRELPPKQIPWKDRHPSADMDPPPGPYDGNGGPVREPRSAIYLRLKKGGVNLLQAALETLHADCAYRSFGDFSCPDGPYTLYKAGMEWVKGPDSPIREVASGGIFGNNYYESSGIMRIEEGPDGKPTEAGYRAWVKRALCEIYPAWALPESFRKPVDVEEATAMWEGRVSPSPKDRPPAPAPSASGIVDHLIKHGWADSGRSSDFPLLRRDGGGPVVKMGDTPESVPDPVEVRMFRLLERTHPMRIHGSVMWGRGAKETLGRDVIEARVVLPDAVSLEAAMEASRAFHKEAPTFGVPYTLVQSFADGIRPARRTSPDAPAGEEPSCG